LVPASHGLRKTKGGDVTLQESRYKRAPQNLPVARSEFARFVHPAREAGNVKLEARTAQRHLNATVVSVYCLFGTFACFHTCGAHINVMFRKTERLVLDTRESGYNPHSKCSKMLRNLATRMRCCRSPQPRTRGPDDASVARPILQRWKDFITPVQMTAAGRIRGRMQVRGVKSVKPGHLRSIKSIQVLPDPRPPAYGSGKWLVFDNNFPSGSGVASAAGGVTCFY
jgi:hypothetical protein